MPLSDNSVRYLVAAMGSADAAREVVEILNAAGPGITALTGDVTATGPGSAEAILARPVGTVGTFPRATVAINAKGQVTAISAGAVGAAVANADAATIVAQFNALLATLRTIGLIAS